MISQNKSMAGLVIIILLAIVAYGFLTMPDQRTAGQRIGDAVDALPKGPDKAVQQLEQRTPGEKLGDAVKDATRND